MGWVSTEKRLNVFLGASGSGKTELSVNFALKTKGHKPLKVCFFDMDQTKGLFRSRDLFGLMSDHGVETMNTYEFMDAPVVPAGIIGKIRSKDAMCIFDVGGNPSGSIMIRQYIEEMDPVETMFYYVINPCRPFCDNASEIEKTMAGILTASGLNPEQICIVSNPNLGTETEKDLVIYQYQNLEKELALIGMKTSILCVGEDMASDIRKEVKVSVFPLKLYVKELYEM